MHTKVIYHQGMYVYLRTFLDKIYFKKLPLLVKLDSFMTEKFQIIQDKKKLEITT